MFQNYSILWIPKAVLVGTIIDREKIHIGAIIEVSMLMRAKKDQSSIPFLILTRLLREAAIVSFRERLNVRIIPASSTNLFDIV